MVAVGHRRARILRFLLHSFVGISLFLELIQFTTRASSLRTLGLGLVAVAGILVPLSTVALWLAWIHRAYSNLSFVGCKNRDWKGARLCWFIPFVNLVRPFQVTRELWLRSACANCHQSS